MNSMSSSVPPTGAGMGAMNSMSSSSAMSSTGAGMGTMNSMSSSSAMSSTGAGWGDEFHVIVQCHVFDRCRHGRDEFHVWGQQHVGDRCRHRRDDGVGCGSPVPMLLFPRLCSPCHSPRRPRTDCSKMGAFGGGEGFLEPGAVFFCHFSSSEVTTVKEMTQVGGWVQRVSAVPKKLK